MNASQDNPCQVRQTVVAVDARSLPAAYFQSATGEPCVLFCRGNGGENGKASFTAACLSAKRSIKFVREAMAAHTVITSATGPRKDRYDASTELFLR